jgi:quercetin dioxygenase-like cupin family protein
MPIIDRHQAPEVPWRPGYRKWDIAGREQGVTSTFSINTAEPGAGAPLHAHSVDELIVIMEGILEVRIDEETQIVGREYTIVIPPGRSMASKWWASGPPSCWYSSRH